MPNRDLHIFDRIKSGDIVAFETLFKDHYAALCRFAHSFLKATPEDPEEIVQGLFADVWEKRSAIPENVSPQSYLFSAVRNRCLNRLNHEKVREAYHSEALHAHQNRSHWEPEERDEEIRQRVAQALNLLPEKCREIFLMSRKQGLRYAEIAEELGISIKTVENQMGKALKILRAALGDLWLWAIALNFFIQFYSTT